MSIHSLSLAILALAPVAARAQYGYSFQNSLSWGQIHNGPGDILASFESLGLPDGLRISVRTATAGYGPSATLPAVYDAVSDGSFYAQGRYDGNCAFLNLFDNRVHGTGDESRAGDLTLDFAAPVSRVGFSLGSLAPGAHLVVNGVDQGLFLALYGFPLQQFGRQGYFTMTGTGIRSFKIVTEPSDIFVIDHLVFTPSPVPEPATFGVLALGILGLARRHRAKGL